MSNTLTILFTLLIGGISFSIFNKLFKVTYWGFKGAISTFIACCFFGWLIVIFGLAFIMSHLKIIIIIVVVLLLLSLIGKKVS
ncbi:hypothetical protein [Clostridium intestinale]|uniref:Uncharacterized protein n=1 Tax=Clostridium intestinale DSM 6191 TaxID=1121320 RepID=A0A1M6A4V6_9CLOT|nr:hypothetical protein [Clostridium intestinale]SHI31409.1 hypothetical protein SAMN02745941_03611 [Clostridium intestinale DSM 6191]